MEIILKTERLNIKPVTTEDIDVIFKLQSLPQTSEFNTSKTPSKREETAVIVNEWIKTNNQEQPTRYTFAVELLETTDFIGLIGINLGKPHYRNAEVWFQYDFRFWNKGYGTESLRRILDFGFNELNLHRIEAGCAVANIGSVSVLEKVGMQREAHTRQLLPLPSGWSDNYGYAILSTDERK